MAAYRLRARLYFVAGNGMAAWAVAQNATRLTQAYHLNPGSPAEERSKQDGAADVYSCDLIFPDEALVQDTWNTLIAVCAPGYLRPWGERQSSWMDMHLCNHAGTPTSCPAPAWSWSNRPTDPAPWVQPTGAHDAYALGAKVTHNGQTWTSTIAANVYEPGVFGWEATP